MSVWDSVPAFSELLVGQAEISGTRLPSCLRLILMSGDWIPLGLPVRLMSLSHSDLRVVSMGGATEAAIWSNTYEIVDGRVPVGWSSVPYGVPMRGQSIDVLEDGSMRRCEPWVVGMIYIGGLGVALGYVGDEAQTSRSFVRHVTSGEHMFRTGDLGRVRPAGPDGRLLIEILGREDAQVKINGFRVELGEIEAILESDENVLRSCVVLLDGRQLVAFVTVPPTSEDSPQLAPSAAPSAACNDDCSTVAVGSARVAYWRDVYEHVYAPSASDNGGEVDEFAGWTSSFDGTPMPKADMSEWLNDTVQRIKSLCDLRSILEIGVGTGMLLTRLIEHSEQYWATDLSERAVSQLKARMDMDSRDVKLFAQPAHAPLTSEDAPNFGTVILNSVAQYFPSAAYLLRVVSHLASTVSREAGSCGTIFLGDLRSLRHLRHFHVAVQSRRLRSAQGGGEPSSATASTLRGALDASLVEENELCVDAALLLSAISEASSPLHLEYSRVLLKRGSADNELNAFRYDILLYAGSTSGLAASCSGRGDV